MLRALSDTSVDLLENDFWVMEVENTNADGSLTDSLPDFVVTSPDASPVVVVAEKLSQGRYRAVVELDQPLRWIATVTSANGVTAFTAYVQAVGGDLPSVADIKDYAPTETSSVSDEIIADAIDAEFADQRSRLKIPAVYDARLVQALKRRVQLNLAWRDVVLTTNIADAEAGTTLQPIYRDPVVSRLEAPFRKFFVR